MAKKKKIEKIPKAWLIAYIDSTQLDNIYSDLNSLPEYKDVEFYIPTVKVLKKLAKNKEVFESVPLLFNYGFFKVPRKYATSKAYLDNMKSNIRCIFAWVNDPSKVIIRKGVSGHRVESYIPVATATDDEIQALVDAARDSTIFSAVELDRVKVGDTITLKRDPWEGMDAIINSIDEKKKTVNVSLILFQQQKEITVSFDSVFFTIYSENNYNPDVLSKVSYDELLERKSADRVTYKMNN